MPADREHQMPAPPRLSIRLPLEPARLMRARQRVREYLHANGVEAIAVDDIVLALEEAMSNAVVHSSSSEDLDILLAFEQGDLVMVVKDRGRGFDVTTFDPAALPDLGQSSGRGLYLISRLMDELVLTSDEGLQVRAVKRGVLGSGAAGDLSASSTAWTDPGMRWEALLDEIDEGFFALDWEYRYVMANSLYLAVAGCAREDIVGRCIWDIFPQLRDHESGRAIRSSMELGLPVRLDYVSPVLHRWFELRAYPTTTGIAGFTRDIDERRRRELDRDALLGKLRDQEERLRLVLDAGSLAAWDWDFDTGRVVWNDEHYRMFGYAPGGVEPGFRAVLARIHPDDRAGLEARFAGARSRGADFSGEFRALWPDGTVRWLDAHGHFKLDERGEAVRSYGVVIDSTARRQAEAELHEREVDLEHAQAVGQIGSWRLDIVQNRLTWSKENCHIFGVPEGTPQTYESFLAIVHPEDRAHVDHAWRAALQGAPYDIEHRALVQGDVKWVRERAYLEHDDRGAVRGGFGITQDITERKRAESALRESEEKLRVAFNHAAIGFALMTPGGRFVDANAAYLGIVGYELDELRTRAFDDLVHPEDLPDNLRLVERMLAGEIEDFVIENRYLRRDGSPVWVRKSVSAAKDDQGATRWIITLVEDITERKHTRESEERLLALMDHNPSLIFLKDAEGRYVYLNHAYEEEFVRSREWVGRTDYDFWPAESADLFRANDEVVLRSGEARQFLEDCRDQDGVRRCWLAYKFPFTDAQQRRFSGGIGIDVTARVEAEEALRRSEERYRTIVETTAEGVMIGGPDGVIEFVNRRMADMLGYSMQELVGMQGLELVGDEWVPRVMRNRAALQAGGVVCGEIQLRRKDDVLLWTAFTSSPLLDPGGSHVGNLTMHTDISERKRAEEAAAESQRRSETLVRIAAIAGSRLDSKGILKAIVAVAGEALACEACIILLHEPDGWRAMQAWSASGAVPDEIFRVERTACAEHVLQEGRPLVFTAGPDETFAGGAAGNVQGLEATLAVPLVVRGEGIGCMFFTYRGHHDYSREEIDFAAAIAGTLSSALGNAQLYETQERIATVLQEHLVHPLPHIDGLELAALSQPAAQAELVGGDFHDVFQTPDGLVVALIGDVMGKGVTAAGLTETVRSAVRALALVSSSPESILGHANKLLLGGAHDQFATALLLVLDPGTGSCVLASAGHPPPFLVAADGIRSPEPVFGPPLGTFESAYEGLEFTLPEGATLLLYTDGLTEARRDGEQFGHSLLAETLEQCRQAGPQELAGRLQHAVLAFAGELKDDLEILALRRTPGTPASSSD